MLRGLLMELDDRNCWTIAEAAGHRGPHRLQHLLSRAVGDDQQVLDIASGWAVSHLDDGDAVLIVDETADEKSSADCAGAARQYSGTVGGVALCQVAVTLTFATSRGHALIGRALYLPEGHQPAVAQRPRPLPRVHTRLTWPDRAWLALLAGTLPIDRLAGMQLIVTPATIMRWHRDIVRRRWARLSRQGRPGRLATHRNVRSAVLRLARRTSHGDIAGSTASWPGSGSPWRHRQCG
jgi:hypothetical protein